MFLGSRIPNLDVFIRFDHLEKLYGHRSSGHDQRKSLIPQEHLYRLPIYQIICFLGQGFQIWMSLSVLTTWTTYMVTGQVVMTNENQ